MDWHDAIPGLLKPIVDLPRLGLISDMDGTLSPIVDVPADARPTPRNRELLRALQTQLPIVALVSGRAAADLQQRVNLPGLIYIGNHGLERWQDDRVITAPEALQFRPQLESALDEIRSHLIPDMRIEDKGATLSVHYRQTADPESAARDFQPLLDSLAARHNLRLYQGRMVFELRPPIEMHKGTAFRQLVTEYQLDAALYLGDDTTDVDALRMAQQLRQDQSCYALGIAVESPDMPPAVGQNADLSVQGVSGVESFLSWLLQARSASTT
jgi:trehalose 6-phosphate phosphatase